MPGNPRELITTAEKRFPVRIRIAKPARCAASVRANLVDFRREPLAQHWRGDTAPDHGSCRSAGQLTPRLTELDLLGGLSSMR